MRNSLKICIVSAGIELPGVMSFAQGHTGDDPLRFDHATFTSLCQFSGIAHIPLVLL